MYRLMLPLLVCACAVRSAPQHDQLQQPPGSGEPALAASLEESFGGAAPGAAEDAARRARQDSATTELGEPDTTAPTDRGGLPSPRTFTRAPRPPRPGPRLISKLSLFNKASVLSDVATNLLERPEKGYRKFTSTCRCEKIWNCPLLQVTVPRCADEFFLCCDLRP